MKKLFSSISLRFIIQLSIVLLIFSLAMIHQTFGVEKAAPIDAYCPFGAVESFFTLIFTGEFLKRIFTSSFILLGIFVIGTIFLGRVFCGYFCPLGAIQEWIRILGRKLGIRKDIELPERYDRYLRWIKYFILGLIIYFSFYMGNLIFRNYDPYSSLMHFGNEFQEKIIGYSILALVLIASLFSKSIWCRYFCPLGAFFGAVKRLSFFNIKRDPKTCISCGSCDRNCPANLKIATADKIDHPDCISCGKCVSKCPKSSLNYNIFGKKISPKIFSILVILLIILPLIIAPFTPFWKTKPESNIVNSKGEINIADIRGSNTLQYVLDTTKVPLSEFQTRLGLPVDVDTSLKLKEIGARYNLKNQAGAMIETEDFRAIIEAYKEPIASIDCPFGKIECEFPGDCGAYVDSDSDRICDHSQ